MNRVTIDGVRVRFLVVVEDNVACERSSSNDMSVRNDQAFLDVSMEEGAEGFHNSYPLSGSTTKPVASLAQAASVSKEQVWQKRMETTHRTTFSMVACHSAVSAGWA